MREAVMCGMTDAAVLLHNQISSMNAFCFYEQSEDLQAVCTHIDVIYAVTVI